MRWLALLPALLPLARVVRRIVLRQAPEPVTPERAETLAADALQRIREAESRRVTGR